MLPRPGDLIGDRYRLGRQIGSGGMAAVFEALDVTLKRRVAAKFLVAENRNKATVERRFLREARIAAAVRHPHVVEVFDFGVEDDAPFMIMELLEGASLAQRTNEPPLMTLGELFDVIDGVLAGLSAIHEAGIVHRDIKPENIYLAEGPNGMVPKVFDFGVSRIQTVEGPISASTTVEGYLVGTPHYMSSEQARGQKRLDGRTDVYSVGVVLYEYLTGHLPFDAELMGDLVIAIATETPKSIYEERPELGRELSDFVEKAMSKLPGDRFATAGEMRDALEAIRVAHPGLDDEKTRLLGVEDDDLPVTHDKPDVDVPMPWDRDPFEVSYDLPSEPPPAPPVPSAEVESPGSAELPAANRSPVVALVAVAAVAVAGVGGWRALREPAPEPTAPEPPGQVAAAPAPDPEPVRSDPATPVTVTLRGVPDAARVRLDGEAASGPELVLERDGREHQLRVEADGMEPYELAFVADADRAVEVALEPRPAPEDPTPTAVAGGPTTRRGRSEGSTPGGRSGDDDRGDGENSGQVGIFRSPDF